MKGITPKKWIISFLCLSLICVMVLSFITYIIDPFFQYRVKDHTYFLNSAYVNSGLIKNYDYDTIIVGSCMIGNTDVDQFRDKLGLNPIKVENGAMVPAEINTYLKFASKIGKAKQYYVNIDLASFQDDNTSVTNDYLMKDDILSKGRYFLGYETWFRFMPVDCALLLYKTIYQELPPGKMTQRTSVDENGTWTTEDVFSEDEVINNRKNNKYKVSSVDLDDLDNRMINNIDSFVSDINFDAGSYTFIFPPYSSLYWCDAQDQGYCDSFIKAKRYFIKKLLKKGCTVYDFQSADLTVDLNNYRDATHFSPEVNAWMVDCFANGDYIINDENMSLLQDNLLQNIIKTRTKYPDLFS